MSTPTQTNGEAVVDGLRRLGELEARVDELTWYHAELSWRHNELQDRYKGVATAMAGVLAQQMQPQIQQAILGRLMGGVTP